MAGVGLLDAVDGQRPDGVDRELIEVRGEGHRCLRWRCGAAGSAARPSYRAGRRAPGAPRPHRYARPVPSLLVSRRARTHHRTRRATGGSTVVVVGDIVVDVILAPDGDDRAWQRRPRPGAGQGRRVGGHRRPVARAAGSDVDARVRDRAGRRRACPDRDAHRRRRHGACDSGGGRADGPDRRARGARRAALVHPGPGRGAPAPAGGPEAGLVRGCRGRAPSGLLAARRAPRPCRHGGHPAGARRRRAGHRGPGLDGSAPRAAAAARASP